MAAAKTLTIHTKVFYGLGEVGEGVKTSALETFLFFYYVQVVGLSGSLAGLALMIALLFDAVTDPAVGAWSDRVRSPLGRRHPFLYAAPIPLAVALWLLFSPPAGGGLITAVWLAGWAIAARFAMTLYFVPHMALGAELSESFRERIALGAYRTVFGYIGRLIALALGFAVFFAHRSGYENGQLDPTAYPGFAIAAGCVVVASVMLSAVGTQRAALTTRAVREERRGAPTNTFAGLMLAMRSRSFRALFIALLIMYLYNGVQFALALHMNTYFWRLEPHDVQLVLYAGMAGFVCGVPFARPLAHALDKRLAYIVGILASVAFSSGPTILRLLGLAPDAGSFQLVWLLVGAGFASGLIGALPVVLSSAMLADLADEHDYLHGSRSEGLFFGVNAFCRKAALGLGGAVAGVMVDLIRFPAKAAPGSVPDDILLRLGLLYAPAMLLVLLIGLAFFLPYDLTRQRHVELLAALDTRNLAQRGSGIRPEG